MRIAPHLHYATRHSHYTKVYDTNDNIKIQFNYIQITFSTILSSSHHKYILRCF